MKTKPTRHKETNRFKFKPFSERINDIDVDVFHKVGHRNEEVSEETETYFYQCLQKWNFLNLSGNYCNLRSDVKDIITLPQLINRKQYVVDTLLKYLKLKDPLCLQTIFELINAVAKDLQVDFYPYFPKFLEAIIDLLQVKDAELLEHTLTALAYLFKFLWRYMIKNIDKIFNLLVPLLADKQPDYINNFAAESFAFVVRKVKDKPAFFKLVLKNLDKRQDGIVGCGKLLFHVLAGVPGQFHSCTENMLNIYFEAILDPEINQELVYDVLSTVFYCIAKTINVKKCEVLWSVFHKVLEKFPENCLITPLRLVQIVINHKGGQMLRDPVSWSKLMTSLIDKHQNNNEVLEEIANTCIATLLASNVQLLQETTSFLILKLLSINDQDLLLKITEKLIVHSSFETLILPQILKRSTFSVLDEKSLGLYTKIIETKSPPSLGGINLNKWTLYSLNIRCKDNIKFLSKYLDSLKEGEITEDVLKVLIILPHLRYLHDELRPKIIENYVSLYKRVLSKNEQQQKINFAFLLATECVVHMNKPDDFHSLIKENFSSDFDLLAAAVLHENDISILNALDLFLSHLKYSSHSEEHINPAAFDKLHESLVEKLGSPNSSIRLTTSHIFSLFSYIVGTSPSGAEESRQRSSILELPFLAECEPATVHKYRDRLLRVQALDYHAASGCLPGHYQDLPLHYLLGNLYVNFSLLWDHVCRAIVSYANKECSSFWPVFLAKLRSEQETTIPVLQVPSFQCDVFVRLVERTFAGQEKVDWNNYKLLLWKCMGLMGQYCEVKNRDYVDLFIDFAQKHFFRSNSELARSCDIKKREAEQSDVQPDLDAEEDKQDVEEEKMDTENNKEDTEEKKQDVEATEKSDKEVLKKIDEDEAKQLLTRNERVKLLLAMLQVFGKFTNPRSFYRESEVLQIYLDLLSSKNSEVQKAALICLYTYKYNYLLPYRAHLDSIVDEKNLKNELARFQISISDEAVVLEEHRSGFMPILMRILHAKMTQRVGMRTGGKSGGLVRRKTILRFLAGVKEDEMMVFVQMAFKPFQNYLPILTEKDQDEINLPQMVRDIFNNINLENVIPPKRLQSSVNLLAVIIEQFGGKMMTKLLPYLFALLICIMAQVAGILAIATEVHPGFLPSIRNVRSSCIKVLVRFFEHFENYDWSSNELDALFDVAVFPWLEKLPIEGIHSPTPLLQMFSVWSQNPRYYPLFLKLNKDNQTSLVFVVKLLSHHKTHNSVVQMILGIFEKMLTLQDFEKEETDQMDVDEEKPKSLQPIVTNKLDIVKNDSINYGSAILLPHVTDILAYLEKKLNKSTRQGVNRTEMTILSRISEFASDSKTCDTLLTLVLPILQKKSGDAEDTVMQLLITVTNLVMHVEEPKKHLRPILQLLAQVSHSPARRKLMELLDKVARDDEIMKSNNSLLTELNAFDSRWIDQPDFERRLNAFKKIDEMIKEDKLTLELGVAIILNSFFFLKNDNDLALRDRSGQCLKTVGIYLAKKYKDSSADRKYLVDETILSMVRRGIRSNNDTMKMQSIAFLGQMAMECPEVHPVFRDLNPLTNKQDPEVDFFENMRHLQLYRRARALQKFCKVARSMTKAPDPRTLTQFILPLASTFLCNEHYRRDHNIVHDAITTVGVICRLLPWNQYEVILKHYLYKLRTSLEFQRQIINILIVILDSFHFDLSKYKEENAKINENLKPTDAFVEKTETTVEESATKPLDESDKVPEQEDVEEMNEEHLDEALATIDEVSPEEATTEQPVKDVPIMEKDTVLSQYMAKRLINSITKGLLPQLHRTLAVRTKNEGTHKLNKKSLNVEREEEELVRVPIALPMVKLLQKLPFGIMNANLRGIFMKICTFLKSHLESVRKETRDNLKKIMQALGPDHLHHLLNEMKALLTRGFQVHVLVFTIHAVLEQLKSSFRPVHMRSNLPNILSVCKIDLFGASAEEKEVAGIVKNVSEARSTKSIMIFHILGECIDEGSLEDVIKPLKEVLMRTHSYKNVKKITECLRQFGLGLADNKFIKINEMLNFLYNASSESIPKLLPENKKKEAVKVKEEKKKVEAVKRQDCFIIPAAPKRMSAKENSKISKDTNVHVMVEFGLMLFHILLKRGMTNDAGLKTILNSFVPLLNDCLKLHQVKLSKLAIQCLRWLIPIDLPAVRSLISEMSTQIILILHKYGSTGMKKGENYDLKMAVYKTMSVIEEVQRFEITSDQLKILLVYIEQDLHNGEKHAFSLLRVLIKRQRQAQEVHQSMKKVRELLVTSELETVRQQAQAVSFMYLKYYKLNKRFTEYIKFYLTQLKYEVQIGRLSVLAVLYKICAHISIDRLKKLLSEIFEKISLRLVEDEEPVCREECAKCITVLLERIEHNQRDQLFNIVISWFNDDEISKRELASQVCGLFVAVEKDKFESRLEKLLPLLTKQFFAIQNIDDGPGKFVKLNKDEMETFDDELEKIQTTRKKDHHLIQVLELILDICTNCARFLTDKKYQSYVDTFAEYIQYFLRHPHLWIRLRATRLLGYVFASLDVKKIIFLLNNPENCNLDDGFIYSNPVERLRSLVLDLIQLFLPETEFEIHERKIFENMYVEIIKHLVFIAKIVSNVNANEENANAENENKQNTISLFWMLKKLKMFINREVIKAPKSIIIRSSVFKWMAGVVKEVDINCLEPMMLDLMLPLVREMVTTEVSNAPLRQMSKEVAKMIEKRISVDKYAQLLTKGKQILDIKRTERRKQFAQKFVTDPEAAAKRKIARQQKKKEAKKRKMEMMKGKRHMRKKVKKEIEIE